jgi:hypothetical protein
VSTLYSVPRACAELGDISRTMLWELARDKKIEKVSIGRRAFITAKSIVAYIDSLSPSEGNDEADTDEAATDDIQDLDVLMTEVERIALSRGRRLEAYDNPNGLRMYRFVPVTEGTPAL